MKKPEFEHSGILLIDKPAGWTSHDVVNFVRKNFNVLKVGHAGTLDPAATGLMIVLLGNATKLSERLTSLDKTYEGTMVLGIETDTQDITGRIVSEKDYSQVKEDDIRQIFSNYVGEMEQIPPMYSAVKKDGKKLYQLARKGVYVDREPKKIFVRRIEIKKIELPYVEFVMVCSKGTYVRTLCVDIGRELGCGATLHSLRRTAIGEFKISESFTLEQIRTWTQDELYAQMLDLFNLDLQCLRGSNKSNGGVNRS